MSRLILMIIATVRVFGLVVARCNRAVYPHTNNTRLRCDCFTIASIDNVSIDRFTVVRPEMHAKAFKEPPRMIPICILYRPRYYYHYYYRWIGGIFSERDFYAKTIFVILSCAHHVYYRRAIYRARLFVFFFFYPFLLQ